MSQNSAIPNEEKEMIECFEKGIRLEGDRYSVGLLWKSEMGQLENNFLVALRRFKNLRNRLNRNPEIFQQYKNVIEEQIKEGIVEECSQEITELSYFMPHREIIKPNETTSCRIVYDTSSSRSNPDSNFSLQQICKFVTTSVKQACSKLTQASKSP
ncbi:hypothetical protein AVEN_99504-1 [Araneus ventricosus]|uniref:Uncharacterized protein n=1 Tax=Araneus ventricosus TaxID=182803 RepID=A0A4Y2R714_ARAVE|nr:hypothetical protein AVEN_99504-1 [Araneus ventricosus]